MLRAALTLGALTLLAGCAASHGSARPAVAAAGPRIVRDPVTNTIAVESTIPAHPDGLIVTVHGHNGHALHQYRSWQPYAKSHRLGLVSVEWQTGWGKNAQFLSAPGTYGMIRRAVAREGVAPGRVLLHGFSQGSHESFALTALDHAQAHLFAMTLAESGGYGGPGDSSAGLGGTRWDVYCAGRDPWPHLSGCPAMRRARTELQKSGAPVIRLMVDRPAGHGGFLRNARDVNLVLGDFARALARR
jgi:predicted esterase